LTTALDFDLSLSLSHSPHSLSLTLLTLSLSLSDTQEFDRFLLPERTAEEDKKKKKFFNNVNSKAILAKGKLSAAAQIQDSLLTAGSCGVDQEPFP
jgi:hypothetical protein